MKIYYARRIETLHLVFSRRLYAKRSLEDIFTEAAEWARVRNRKNHVIGAISIEKLQYEDDYIANIPLHERILYTGLAECDVNRIYVGKVGKINAENVPHLQQVELWLTEKIIIDGRLAIGCVYDGMVYYSFDPELIQWS